MLSKCEDCPTVAEGEDGQAHKIDINHCFLSSRIEMRFVWLAPFFKRNGILY